LRLPHFLDSRLIDGGEIVSLTLRPSFTTQEDSWYSFLLQAESVGRVRLIEKSNDLIGIRTLDLRVVVWCLNQVRYHVPPIFLEEMRKTTKISVRTDSVSEEIYTDPPRRIYVQIIIATPTLSVPLWWRDHANFVCKRP
jgi:hypothetical protein